MHVKSRLLVILCVVAMLAACAGAPSEQSAQNRPTATTAVAATLVATVGTVVPPTQQPSPTPVPPSPTPAPPSPTPVPPSPTPITGELALGRGAAQQRLITVMIDNHPAAYPQTGLDHGVMVFEALAEFGITRYMLVLAPGISPDAEVIGPVRSARSYFVEWAKGLNAVYAHAGGSPEGLLLAETAVEIANMDALRSDAGNYFWRSTQRAAPHNLYTSSAELQRFVTDKGVADFAASELGFRFKPEADLSRRPASQRIDYYFLYADETVGWRYDPQLNSYLRLRRGVPHIDARSGEQLQFKNVVMMEVPEAPIPNDPKGRIEQQVIGEGRARIFTDGIEREAIWRKPAGFAPLRFYDASGNEIAFNAGAVWIAALPTLDNLTVEGGG